MSLRGAVGRLRGLAGGWADDPAWAHVYSYSVDHPRVGVPGWRLAVGSDLRPGHHTQGETAERVAEQVAEPA